MSPIAPAPDELSLKVTEEDGRAMRESRQASRNMSPAEYLRFFSQFTYSYESLRARPLFKGEPFSLID